MVGFLDFISKREDGRQNLWRHLWDLIDVERVRHQQGPRKETRQNYQLTLTRHEQTIANRLGHPQHPFPLANKFLSLIVL